MAAVNMAMNGERTSHDKAYSKPLENGLLPAVAEKLELEETGAIVGDKGEMEDEFEDEEPPVGEIKVRKFNIIHVHMQTDSMICLPLVTWILHVLASLHLMV